MSSWYEVTREWLYEARGAPGGVGYEHMAMGGKGVTTVTPLERAREFAAQKFGISRTTLFQVEYLIKHAPREELEKLRRGEKAIYNLYLT